MQNDDHRKAFATASHAQEIVRKAEMIAEEIRDLEGEKTDDDMPGLAAPVYDSGLAIPSTTKLNASQAVRRGRHDRARIQVGRGREAAGYRRCAASKARDRQRA